MSNANQDFTGSAARHHEAAGGNVQAERIDLPRGGDAARQSETEGDAINEAHGVRAVPRHEYRGGGALRLPQAVGARLVEAKPLPDLSSRTAADYLPPQLKANLIAEGRLAPDGAVIEPAERTAPAEPPQRGIAAWAARWFRKLF